jgi:hypothetical protein
MISSTASSVPKISFSFDSEIPFPYIATHMEYGSAGGMDFDELRGLSRSDNQYSNTPTLQYSPWGAGPKGRRPTGARPLSS